MDSNIKKLQNELKHQDPHFRQNAVIGLGEYFKNEQMLSKLKDEEKTNIIRLLLERLLPKEDCVEVKSQVVKVFKQIATYLKEAEIVEAFTQMIKYITDEKAEGKDIYVNCIKTIIEKVPGPFYEPIGKTIIPYLNKVLAKTGQENEEIVTLCMDCLNEYIDTFDYMLLKNLYKTFTIDKMKVVEVCLAKTLSSNGLLKANSIKLLGTVSILLDKKQVSSTTSKIISLIKNAETLSDKKNYILALKSLGKNSSSKQTEYYKTLMGIFSVYTNLNYLENDSNEYDEKNAMVDACLGCLEIYIGTSLDNIKDRLKEIINSSLDLIKYDPNYQYEAAEGEVEGYDGYEDIEFDAVLDDSSWTVRRGAAKILSAIIKSGFNLEKEDKEKIITELVDCIKEHDENTKLAILDSLSLYLNSLVMVQEKENGDFSLLKKQSSIINDFIPKIANLLLEKIKTILTESSENIKNNVFKLLPIIALIAPSEIIGNFNSIKPEIEKICENSNENLRTLFDFFSKAFQNLPISDEYTEIYPDIMNFIKKGLNNSYYKVCTAAIDSCRSLFPILVDDEELNKPRIMTLYKELLPKFQVQDIDPEIKVSTIKAMSVFVENCGHLLKETDLIQIFNIYVEKSGNELLRPNVLTALNSIVNNDNNLPLNNVIKVLSKMILDILANSPTQVQSKALNLLESIFKNYPGSLNDSVGNITKKVLEIKNSENLINHIYKLFKAMIPVLSTDLLNSIFSNTQRILGDLVIDKKNLKPLYEFTKEACRKLKKDKLNEMIKDYAKKMKSLNENVSYFASILICYSDNEKKVLELAINCLSTTSENTEISNILQLIGNICENSQEKHDDFIKKIESLKGKINVTLHETLYQVIGKIGANNPEFFIDKIISQNQDHENLISLKEFLELVRYKKKTINKDGINKIISWLLKTANLKDEQNNKFVGSCIGLLIAGNTNLMTVYIKLVNQSNAEKKSSLLNGLQYIFKSDADLGYDDLESLINIAIDGIKQTDRLIKEHSMQGINALQEKHGNKILNLYVNNDTRNVIQNSCKIDKNYIREVDFGRGNKITEDKGIEIRKAALSIITYIIDNYPIKLNSSEAIALFIDCLLDTEDYLQQVAYDNLTTLAHLNSSNFSSYGGTLIETLFKVWRRIKIEESKKNFSVNVKRLFEELKDEPGVTENPKYNAVVEEINKH